MRNFLLSPDSVYSLLCSICCFSAFTMPFTQAESNISLTSCLEQVRLRSAVRIRCIRSYSVTSNLSLRIPLAGFGRSPGIRTGHTCSWSPNPVKLRLRPSNNSEMPCMIAGMFGKSSSFNLSYISSQKRWLR